MSQFRANVYKQKGGAGLKTERRVAVVHSAFSSLVWPYFLSRDTDGDLEESAEKNLTT